MKRFIGILQFLTRIPIPFYTGIDEDFHKSIVYFPLVGFVLGIFYYGIGVVSTLVFPTIITSLLILLSTVLLTGGLHLDGVGDTFDGLYSYRDKDRILEIMKDSRLGTNGLLAIIFLLLFKLGFIYYLVQDHKLWQLIIMPMIGRVSQVIACYGTRAARENGMGNLFIGKASGGVVGISLSYTIGIIVLLIFLLIPEKTLYISLHFILLPILFIVLKLCIREVYKKIQGITGDILGAICELMELAYLLVGYILASCLIR